MIYGIGIDIVNVDRMRDADKKWGQKFFERILSADEIKYCFGKSDPFPSVAVRFAAKEALIKAIGAEITVRFKDIEILNTKAGRPLISVKGALERFFNEKGIRHCHVSLSHEKEFGIGCVLLET